MQEEPANVETLHVTSLPVRAGFGQRFMVTAVNLLAKLAPICTGGF
ncbi:MAG: hypothetical protein N4J56_003924 [Chroococcidiopsis sp. SAG 2025]|nr:hypothetical protein [Chroococcidiopsis sp. SAG 2025]MDV2994270.1 hypothetical protein [Chroococcidiopsis sp. SAG 2025]